MFAIQIALCALIAFICYLVIKEYRFRKVLRKLPSPPGSWLLGNVGFILKNPFPNAIFNYFRECASKYGPIYRFSPVPHIVTVNLMDPSDLEIILSQMKHLQKSRVYRFLENWLGEGLLTSTGLKWQKRRKLLTPAFHFNVLQKFLNVFNEETANMIKQIEEANATHGTFESIGLLPLITHMTLQSIAETAMGINHIEQDIVKTYRGNIHKMGGFILGRVTKPWRQLKFLYSLSKDSKKEKETIHDLHEFTHRVIKQREQELLNKQYEEVVSTSYSGRKVMKMLDLLLYEKIYNEGSIDYEGIREEVDTFMFEGHDTSAAAILFLLYSLATHPDIQEEVRKEIDSVISPNCPPTYNDLQELPYTERVIKESLRLFPPVPFISRIASEDFVTHTGYNIPKGAILHMHIFDMHRNPDIYPDPLKFDPDRFLPENSSSRHPFSYLPFSAGARNCIGQKFALLEIKAVISGILRKFQLIEDPTNQISFYLDLILRLEKDVKIKFVPIENMNSPTFN